MVEKDEAYYLQKKEDLRRKSVGNVKPAWIVQEESDDDGRTEVWSTNRKMRKFGNPHMVDVL